MCNFLTLKMLLLALALIKQKITILTFFNGKFSPGIKNQWVKKMAIFCFDQRQSQF